MASKVLVIAAHHDDETLGCGATIARRSAEGHTVQVLVLGEGPASRDGIGPAFLKAISNCENACRLLGAELLHGHSLCRLPDNKFDTVPLLDVVRTVEATINSLKPDVIYTQHGGDLNIDHAITYRATLVATRPLPGCSIKEVYAYEVPSSTEWAFGQAPFTPNVFMDISGGYLDKKIKAMEMYETERRPFPHPRSPEALRALALWRGAQAGLPAAEAFQLVRSVR